MNVSLKGTDCLQKSLDIGINQFASKKCLVH